LARRAGLDVLAIDPLYELPPEEMERRCREDIHFTMERLRQSPTVRADFELGPYQQAKLDALELFLSDRQAHPETYQAGALPELALEDNSFDLVLDRGALVCVGHEVQRQAIAEARRVLRPGGIFLYNGFSDRHTSGHSGTLLPDGRVTDMQDGTLAHTGSCCFTSRREVDSFFATGWHIERRELMELEDLTSPRVTRHSEWRVFARKV
jgi:SAM-dependent methyltransferase